MTATTVSQAVATRDTGIVSVMWGRKTHFAAVLPDHIDVKSFLGTAAAALYASQDLMRAAERSPDSLITAMMRCASLGHQPGTDEFYLVPRKRKGVPEVQGIEGYRGIVERMYRSGAVASVVVREVCAKDKFRYIEGVDDKPLHAIGGGDPHSADSTGADFFGETGSRDRGAMVGVYAYAILSTGAVSRVVILSRDDVMAAREASDSKDSDYSPWNRLDGGKDRPEFKGRAMWWKTAARRLEPWVPTSAEYRREQLRAVAAAHENTTKPPEHPAPVAPAPEAIYDAEVIEEQPADGRQALPGTEGAAEPPLSTELGSASTGQLERLWTVLSTRYEFTKDDRAQARQACEQIIGRKLARGLLDNLSETEAAALLARFEQVPDRGSLLALLANKPGAAA